MTTTDLTRADEARGLAELETEDLKHLLEQQMQVTADHDARRAAIWVELERRGEDMSRMRTGLAQYLPAVAARRLLPEAVVRLAGNRLALRAIASLEPDEQRRVLDAGSLLVVRATDTPADAVPLTLLTQADVRRAINPITGRSIPPEAQRQPARRIRQSTGFTHRVIVPLTEAEHRKLQDSAHRSQRSSAELIRQILKTDGTFS